MNELDIFLNVSDNLSALGSHNFIVGAASFGADV